MWGRGRRRGGGGGEWERRIGDGGGGLCRAWRRAPCLLGSRKKFGRSKFAANRKDGLDCRKAEQVDDRTRRDSLPLTLFIVVDIMFRYILKAIFLKNLNNLSFGT